MKRRLFLAVPLLVAFGLGAWAFWLEPASVVVRSQTIALPDWPPSQGGLTIALLSDLHVGSPHFGFEALERVVDRVNESNPDIVLLAGDYVIQGVAGGSFVTPEQMAPVLGGLRAKMGVYAVLGNHDWWLGPERLRESFEREGLTVLQDEVRLVTGACHDVWLVGLDDYEEVAPDPERVVGLVPETSLPIIVFTHNPDLFPEVPRRVDLTLAGHTHGGQVRLPLLGTPIVPSRYGSRYVRGLVIEDGRRLFVTTGLGTSIIPVRFRVPPEVVLLRLVAAGGRNSS